MTIIRRVRIPVEPPFTVPLPMDAKTLRIALYEGNPCLWFTIPAGTTNTHPVLLRTVRDNEPAALRGFRYLGSYVAPADQAWRHVFMERL